MRFYGRRCKRMLCSVLPSRCCSSIYKLDFERLFPVIDFLIRKVIGRFLFLLVFTLLLFVLLVTGAIVVPYESLHKPACVIYALILFAVYITVNLFFHYYQACTVTPGTPPKSNALPQCRICGNHKPPNAHHCSICNICVLNMDHHCIWINQCVGAKNHRYFLQFVVFITIGCGTFVLAASNTFYYNYWRAFGHNQMFCDSELLASQLPWFGLLCDNGPSLIISTVFFTYLLCVIVFFLVGALFYWNFVLISCGETYLGVLIQPISCGRLARMVLFPCWHSHFQTNWRRFLGLDGKHTVVRHILFPSVHEANAYWEWDGYQEQHNEEREKLIPTTVEPSIIV